MCVPSLAVTLRARPLTLTRPLPLPRQAKSATASCSCPLQLHLLAAAALLHPRSAPLVVHRRHPVGCSIIRQRSSFGPCPCCLRPLRRLAPCRVSVSASRASPAGPSLELPSASFPSLCPFWHLPVCKEQCLTIEKTKTKSDSDSSTTYIIAVTVRLSLNERSFQIFRANQTYLNFSVFEHVSQVLSNPVFWTKVLFGEIYSFLVAKNSGWV